MTGWLVIFAVVFVGVAVTALAVANILEQRRR